MNIAIVGTGYVGLVTGTCFAEMGAHVTCVDVDAQKIQKLKDGIMPIYEPGLEELVKRNVGFERLKFTTDLTEVLDDVEVVFSAVGTPPDEDGSADLKYVLAVARQYQLLDDFPNFEKYALCDQIRRAIVSVPSNLAEGSGRISLKEQLHFYEISYGSLMETYNQLMIASDLKYIGENSLTTLRPQIDTVARMLNGLRSSLLKKLDTQNGKQ